MKRNGKGKEYDPDDSFELAFEGDFLNGEKNGIGKEYKDINGNIDYEGMYLNGQRNGKG